MSAEPIRKARAGDVAAMRETINAYAREDRMLERSDEFLFENLRDFSVAEVGGAFAGCCALHVLTPDLAEIRSLAVPLAVSICPFNPAG